MARRKSSWRRCVAGSADEEVCEVFGADDDAIRLSVAQAGEGATGSGPELLGGRLQRYEEATERVGEVVA
jgi:hypothetical protein